MSSPASESDVVDIRPYLRRIWAKRLPVMTWAVVGVILGAAYNFQLRPLYRSSAVLLLPIGDGGVGSALSSLSMLVPGSAGPADPLGVLSGIAQSRTALEYISKRSDRTIKELDGMLKMDRDTAANQATISFTAPSKEESLKLTKLSLEAVSSLYASLNVSSATTTASVLEKQVNERTQQVEQAEKDLLAFQKSMKTVPPTPGSQPSGATTYTARLQEVTVELQKAEQALRAARQTAGNRAEPSASLPSGIPEIEKWRERVNDLEYQLRLAQNSLGPTAPRVVSLKRDIATTKQELQKATLKYLRSVNETVDEGTAQLEANRLMLTWQRDYLSGLANLEPGEALEFQKKSNELASRYKILETIRIQYEAARTNAQVDKVRYSILTPPFTEDEDVNKSYARFGLIGGFAMFLIGAAFNLREPKKSGRRSDLSGDTL